MKLRIGFIPLIIPLVLVLSGCGPSQPLQQSPTPTSTLPPFLPTAFAGTPYPYTNSFKRTGSLDTARGQATAVLLNNGKVLIAGGAVMVNNAPPSSVTPFTSQALSSAELYDPATGKFSVTGSMKAARVLPTSTLLPDGRVLIAGGCAGVAIGPHLTALSSAEIYDPKSGSFISTGDMVTPRCGAQATLLPNGKVLIVGSLVGTTTSRLGSSAAEIYDPATGKFSVTGNMNAPRGGSFGLVLTPNGKVLVAGDGLHDNAIQQYEVYDPVAGTFSTVSAPGNLQDVENATLLPNGEVLAVGTREPDGYMRFEIFNPSSNTFSVFGKASIQEARYSDKPVVLQNGKVLLAGVTDVVIDPGNPTAASQQQPADETYDPVSGKTATVSRMNALRVLGQTETILPNGQVLFAGGFQNINPGSGITLGSAELFS